MITKELLILPEHLSSTPVFSGVRVTRSFVLWVVFCSSLFLLSFFFWPLCCLSFFDLQIIITPLVSSSISSCNKRNTTGATSGAVTTYSSGAHEVTPCCSIFSCPCSVLSFFFWRFYCLFFYLRLLITLLVSSKNG